MEPEDKLYTVKDISERLQTSVDYVYRLINAGLLPSLKLGRLKVRKQSLEQFLAQYEGYDLTNPFDVKPLPYSKGGGAACQG